MLKFGASTFLALFAMPILHAQSYQPTPGDTLKALSVSQDGKVTFQLYAPAAKDARIGGTDIPEKFRSQAMTKDTFGIWSVTVGPLAPGAYRYRYVIDQIAVLDPRNPSVSESNEHSWSLFYVPGADFMETKNVPHGAVAEVTYFSTALNRARRMHVYTPPGYELGKDTYPVLYLLHGAFDSDDSWPTVGRAGFILDNMIAETTAVPMIVVMPAGHTGPFSFSTARSTTGGHGRDEFLDDFEKDIRPFVERTYRLRHERTQRAIAGLSMGGAHTLDIAFTHLADFGYLGVFSSGLFELGPMGGYTGGPSWEERNLAALDDKDLKKELRLFWFATGREDFLLGITRSTVALFRKHGFAVNYKETSGGHTWENWRVYLNEFAPQLFK